jgi:tetratricopeptide (TPR) repeat protein
MKYIATLILVFSISIAIGQNVESEIGFIYMKAEYLLETERYDEAISEYSKVINIDPSYKDAIGKRATAKYALYSFSGVKSDIMESISINGIDANGVRLLGLSNSNMGNHQAAVGSLILANTLFPSDKEVLSALGTSALKSGDPRACKVLEKSSSNDDGKRYVSTICSNIPKDKPSKTRGSGKTKPKTTETVQRPDNTRIDDIVTNDPRSTNTEDDRTDQTQPEDTPPVEEEPEAVIDDVVNEIIIDEDLTVIVKNGLGSRRIIDQPSILLLSEKAGQVTVDICVSTAGRVESAKLNESETTINTESLKSLALRKAKEFWFGRGEEECGTIVLVINGG